MADSVLSITVRDPNHPCAPYQSSGHSFRVQIHHCDGTPLFWRGINYGHPGVWLDTMGAKRGRIHTQVKLPPRCYLVRAVAPCKNVVTDWAHLGVGCDQTVCVSLLVPTVLHCILRTILGLLVGTADPPKAGEGSIRDMIPDEVDEAVRALRKIAEKLPPDLQLPAPPHRESGERAERETSEGPGRVAERPLSAVLVELATVRIFPLPYSGQSAAVGLPESILAHLLGWSC